MPVFTGMTKGGGHDTGGSGTGRSGNGKRGVRGEEREQGVSQCPKVPITSLSVFLKLVQTVQSK
ncbi:hypothetical protein EDM53_04080 [Rickettsiales endosymbiont of Peranema trichophorum]|uniref:hypothetical protein n=1 Tax=Rickettsiales endosymbiont of Peranema trichophorum TaxID=2486577 RepID=UPI0010234E01|nr:hypothetical protein [Rickettsiales endosymbiont of Peranema trichophorum]RZI46312.1 hypothetical protein EDM53_04080 [Rickettsiales endosymbiont of Peranema trichophorum]